MSILNPHFSKRLISWYLDNKRDLIWRKTVSPYHIWLSEIMLQQTRVAQGLPYYLKFINAYPTVQDLANSPEDEVLKLWQGLGYYSRARNLHATAKRVTEEMNGVFPDNYKDLLKLKGVGEYTASAIASICFNEPQAVVDGNVYRVLSRVFGVSTPINKGNGPKEFKNLAQQLIDKEQPGTFNQAIMEFGARHCVPKNPNCNSCIFNDVCVAFKKNEVEGLPVKIKAKPVKKRYFNYLVVLSDNENTILKQRIGKGIWHKLYEFPLIETLEEVDIETLKNLPQFQDFSENLDFRSISLFNEEAVVHKLSHQHLYTRFWILETAKNNQAEIPISEINKYAVPVLIENFVSEFFENY
ncbi:A/G-specific adenine glycosylase [Aequorivita xiaoshiensis]|uniref:Adenine DNA glycosylase n=1 Tax=Aequorivita xiaoshiensis TaxID=2874476 RepID=A0A9X1R137_9FLAO|nr:A/G-specific adenine glycosylase [Aequorivita xiaoshiensis]MCG2429892.1 A/G-specific adenine glycosylase [Aequorivita xiaoshiensis]